MTEVLEPGGPRLWVNMEIVKGADFAFDVVWTEEDETTVIPIVSLTGQVKDKYDGEVLLDLGTHTTIDGAGHGLVRVSETQTASLVVMERAVYSIYVTSATETICLMAGTVRIREDV